MHTIVDSDKKKNKNLKDEQNGFDVSQGWRKCCN